jgi:hypothetical protein
MNFWNSLQKMDWITPVDIPFELSHIQSVWRATGEQARVMQFALHFDF